MIWLFSLSGPVFLIVFFIGIVLCVCFERVIRILLKSEGRSAGFPRRLDAYQLSYLFGGKRRCMMAAAVGLAHQGFFTEQYFPILPGQALPQDSTRRPLYVDEIEESTKREIGRSPEYPGQLLSPKKPFPPPRLVSGLVALGLLADVRSLGEILSRLVGIAPLLVLILIGLLRVSMALPKGFPVGFLCFEIIFAACLAIPMFIREPEPTVAAAKLETEMCKKYGALETTLWNRQIDVSASDIMLAVAVFGEDVLLATNFAWVPGLFPRPAAAGGADLGGDSDSSSSSCSGGCGSGCGGCGG